jgi:hypothetical protein
MISKNKIDQQREGEKVVSRLRRHWFIFFQIFIAYALLFLLPLPIYFFISWSVPEILVLDLAGAVLAVLLFSYYLSLLLFGLTVWTDNYLDGWTITTHRIINREQLGLFNRVTSELDLDQIQDITVEQKGFLSTILDYGYVYVQTAGEKERFVFEQVPRPQQVARIIEQIEDDQKEKQLNPRAI